MELAVEIARPEIKELLEVWETGTNAHPATWAPFVVRFGNPEGGAGHSLRCTGPAWFSPSPRRLN